MEEFDRASETLQSRLKNRGYKDDEILTQIKRARAQKREDLLEYKVKEASSRIPFILTYNPTLPNAKEAIDKHWSILQINAKMQTIFKEKPIIAFRRNTNLGDILGQKNLKNGIVIRKKDIMNKSGRCSPCYTRSDNLCCNQIENTSTFRSQRTKKEFQIFHRVNCKSTFIIYLLECTKCGIQYIGKSERAMNIRLNKHRNDVFREDAINVCRHFKQSRHNMRRSS